MNNARLIVAACLIATCSILAFAGRQAQTAPTNVLVTNTSSQSVPVSLFHSVNVPVVQGGTWSVVANGDRNRFFFTHGVGALAGPAIVNDSFTVPSGKHLIIDQISVVSSGVDVDHCFTVGNVIAQNGSNVHGAVFLGMIVTANPKEVVSNLQVQLDALAGDTVTLTLQRTLTDQDTGMNWSVSGHFVP